MNRLVALLRPYAWLLRTSAARRDVLVTAVSMSLFIFIVVLVLGQLWQSAFAGGGTIAGYSLSELVWYIAFAEASVAAVDQRLMRTTAWQVTSGEILMVLVRPLSFLWYVVSDNVGKSLPRLALVLPLTCLIAWILAGPPPSGPGLLTLIVTLPLAVILQVVLVVGAAGGVFWLGETQAMWFVYQKLVFLCGGMLLPLEFFPHALGQLFKVLPWAGTAYWPARLAVDPTPAALAEGVALQVGWIIGASLAASWLYARGERRLVVQGG